MIFTQYNVIYVGTVMITNLKINEKEFYTAQLSELENSQYFKNYLKNQPKEDILNNFDFVMSKIKAKEVEDWDSV
ncbi:hypothetical protein V1L52_00255 [Treponema sp. HNW]|uniref:hypothetical protein n=1 Tax=Treponema sp. HNW TaxID=3116654 RepID=UPI003D0DF524